MRILRSFFVVLLFVVAAPAAAQSDVLTGIVKDHEGKPLAGAKIEVISTKSEITRSGITKEDGRYTIVFPEGGGLYVMRASSAGMQDYLVKVARKGAEEQLLTNVVLYPKRVGPGQRGRPAD